MRPSTLPALLALMGTLFLFAPTSGGSAIYPMPGWQANLSSIDCGDSSPGSSDKPPHSR